MQSYTFLIIPTKNRIKKFRDPKNRAKQGKTTQPSEILPNFAAIITMNLYMKFLLFLALAILPLSALAEDAYVTDTDIQYSQNTDEYSRNRCRLDIYHPDNGTEQPVVVWFHGGGLTGGSKFIPEELKNSGMVVVAVNYRLLPQVDIEECIDDAASAVAWTFKNIGQYNGSAQKIFVAGHSAGGYLASMIGLDKQWLGRYGVDADSISALVPYSGQAITHFAHRKKQGIGELQPSIDSFAPLFHVRPDAPPYIIITGDREQEIFGRYEENAYLWRMMNLVGHKQTYIYELDGYNHGDMAVPAHHILKNHIRRILAAKAHHGN